MIVEGSYGFAAPVERVFTLLLDPDVMAKAMPGARDLKRVGDDRYEGVIRVGVGPITAAEFSLAVQLKDVAPPQRYAMDIDSKGRFGFTRGTAQVQLTPTAAGTEMNYRADLQVGGKIAGVGQRLLDSISKLMTRQGLDALSKEIERRLAAP
jgi:carbon monoxide dehydrogenase subunit G